MHVYVWHDFIPVSPSPAPHIPVLSGNTHLNFDTFSLTNLALAEVISYI